MCSCCLHYAFPVPSMIFISSLKQSKIQSDRGCMGDADPEISRCSFIYCPILAWCDLPSLGLLTNVQMPLSLFSPDSFYFVTKKDFNLCSVPQVFLLGLLWFLHPAAVVLWISDPREMLHFLQICNFPCKEKRELDEEVKTGQVFTVKQRKVLLPEPFTTWVKHCQVFWEEWWGNMEKSPWSFLVLLGDCTACSEEVNQWFMH